MPAKIPCYCHAIPTTERELHKTLVGYLRVALPPEWLVNHQPNEGKRGWTAQRDLGDLGVVTGWPDLQLVGPGGVSYWLELKMPRGTESPAQAALARKFSALGCHYALVRSYQQAEQALIGWGVPLSVPFGHYAAAWASQDRLTAEQYCRLILAAAPPIKPIKATKPKKAGASKAVSKAPKTPTKTRTKTPTKTKGVDHETAHRDTVPGTRRAA